MSKIRSISIVGTGNVAFHLGKALHASGWNIEHVYGRNAAEGKRLAALLNANYTEKIPELEADLIILCINDDAIQSLSQMIPAEKLVAHTSGSISLEALGDRSNKAVIYPLQTFSKEKETVFSKVPLLVEASNDALLHEIATLCGSLTEQVVCVSSDDRKKVHLNAVFINNFVNHLVFLSQELMNQQGLDWNLLKPLLRETIEKLDILDPLDAQTGPARRGDLHTIEAHSALLKGVHKEIYELFTRSIMKTYGQS
ncbi:MAG: Rossmann-like and DUF2520 domain-containing protein [Bacteroidota bacterium]